MGADIRARGQPKCGLGTLPEPSHPPTPQYDSTLPSPMPYQMKAIAKDSFLYRNKYILRYTRL